eukprot:4304805-Pleurochrysis_carterae.AAC.3
MRVRSQVKVRIRAPRDRLVCVRADCGYQCECEATSVCERANGSACASSVHGAPAHQQRTRRPARLRVE